MNFSIEKYVVSLLKLFLNENEKFKVATKSIISHVGSISIDNLKQNFSWLNIIAYFFDQAHTRHSITSANKSEVVLSSRNTDIEHVVLEEMDRVFIRTHSFLACSNNIRLSQKIINFKFYLEIIGPRHLFFTGKGGIKKINNCTELAINEEFLIGLVDMPYRTHS